jgi:tetratricopeptide (TPR) repeat protein
MNEPQPGFLDVPTLLEQSQPRSSGMRAWQALGVFMLVVLGSAYLSSRSGQMAGLVQFFSYLIMLGLIGAMILLSRMAFNRARDEHLILESIEELVRLRRWPQAAATLQQLLSQPTRTLQARVQGLIFLTGVLARYNRFDDAITVQNELLDNAPLDPGTQHGLRLARAMAMLRADHLFDADRAIVELRRQVLRAGRAMSESQELADPTTTPPDQPQSLSAGLALVELYRDVKTGHPAEAIELFNSTLPALREQLGHRVADAHALVARAYDLLEQPQAAQQHYRNATLLSPTVELHRRYPETQVLSGKYEPAAAPKEMA